MSVTTTNLILGPAQFYSGAYGATEPLDTAVATVPDSLVWTDVGGTTDGVSVVLAQDFTELQVDQIVDRLGSRLSKREQSIKTNMAEPTLENLSLALNGATIASGSGYKSLEPNYATSATQPTYKAILIDGYAPGGFRRRIIVRRALSTANVEFAYKKDDQNVFTVTFTGHYVSSSIAPFKIVDQTS
jgi:hypothetical protein